MDIYLVTYDLNKSGQNYSGLTGELKKYDWWHYLDSTWLIYTSDGANQIYNKLSKHLDSNDNILIMQFGNDYQGYLPSDAWEWINSRKRKVSGY